MFSYKCFWFECSLRLALGLSRQDRHVVHSRLHTLINRFTRVSVSGVLAHLLGADVLELGEVAVVLLLAHWLTSLALRNRL